MQNYQLFIDGAFRPAAEGAVFKSENPYTGEAWATIPRASSRDVDAAVSAADRAFRSSSWADMTASQRGRLLLRFADAIEADAEHLARIEVQDNGKLFAEMSAQTRYLAEWYRYYGGIADKIEGAVIPTDKKGIFNFTRHEPLGVVACITPWNSPLLLLAWKLAPLLAAGCTAVIKPSEFTSASTLELAALAQTVGFPAGVINVVTGFGNEAGAALVAHPGIAKVAFTGSDIAGAKIYEAAARDIKHVSLELGGKSPNIIFADADLNAAVIGAISGIFAATGQTCIAGSRLLVERAIHDEVVERIVDLAKSARIGDPMQQETNVGPVTTKPQLQKILDYIEIAKSEGAKCVLGGRRYDGAGSRGGQFVEPTIFTNVTNKMRIAQEEVFGPILAIIPFEGEDEAVAIANDVRFGLAAGVWTENMSRAIRMSQRLQVGTVWVNTYRAVSYTSPFGGYKHSGIGRENGPDAIKEFLQVKSVWIAIEKSVRNPFIIG